MIEIFQILLLLLSFTTFLLVPFNIFNKSFLSDKITILENSSLNFSINLNLLLLASLLSLNNEIVQPYFIFFYSFIIIFTYRNSFKSTYKFLIFLIPLFIIFFILSFDLSSKLYLGWDAKFFYYIKALFFYEQKTIFELNQFSENIWHPHFGSYLWGFFWSLSFMNLEFFGRLFYIFIFCYAFFNISRINKNELINNLIFFIIVVIFYEYNFFSGLQEILIFSILVLISKNFYSLSINKNSFDFILIILYSNLLIWIKSEGIVYFLIILSLLLFQNNISIKKRFSLLIFFVSLYIFKFIIYEYYNLNIDGQKTFYNINYISNLDVEVIFYKIKFIIIWLTYYILNNVFFALFLIIILYEKFYLKTNSKIKKYDYVLLNYLIFVIIFIFCAYIFRNTEIIYSIRTTMDRLVMTSSGLFVLPCILKLNYLFKLNRFN